MNLSPYWWARFIYRHHHVFLLKRAPHIVPLAAISSPPPQAGASQQQQDHQQQKVALCVLLSADDSLTDYVRCGTRIYSHKFTACGELAYCLLAAVVDIGFSICACLLAVVASLCDNHDDPDGNSVLLAQWVDFSKRETNDSAEKMM